MNEIGIDYIKVRAKIKRLSDLYAELAKEINRIAESSADLDIFWDGDANAAFVLGIEEDMVRTAVLLTGIRDAIRCARTVFDDYQVNERQVRMILDSYIDQ